MALPQQALTTAMTSFQSSFVTIQKDFLGYGEAIFFGLLTIASVLKFLEYAANKDMSETMPNWMRELLLAGFFYTVMLNLSWLSTLPQSANTIGLGYLGSIDPSSIILQGINISNKIMKPLTEAGLFEAGAALFIGLIASVVVMYCLMNIAINVAVTIVVTQALISLSPLFLAGGAFQPSRQVARNVIDAIIGNSVKLMGYYLVIYIGNTAITKMMGQMEGTFSVTSFSVDQYGYIVAVTALYYAVAKTLPDQLAKLISGVVQENRGTELGAAAMAMQRVASQMSPLIAMARTIGLPMATGTVKLAGSTLANAVTSYKEIVSSAGKGGISAAGKAAGSALSTLAQSTGGAVADKYRDIASRISGGSGNSNVKSVTGRMHQSTQSAKAQIQANKVKQPNIKK